MTVMLSIPLLSSKPVRLLALGDGEEHLAAFLRVHEGGRGGGERVGGGDRDAQLALGDELGAELDALDELGRAAELRRVEPETADADVPEDEIDATSDGALSADD